MDRRIGPGSGVPGAAVQNPYAERRSLVLDGSRVRYWFYDVDRSPKPLLVMVHGFRGDHHGLQLIADALREHYHVVVPDLPGFGRSEPLRHRAHDVAGYADFLRRFVEVLTDGAVHDDTADAPLQSIPGTAPHPAHPPLQSTPGTVPNPAQPPLQSTPGTAGSSAGQPPESAPGTAANSAAHGIAVLGHSFGSVVAAHFAADHPTMVERLVLVNPICEPALEGGQAGFSRAAVAYYRLGRALPRPLGLRLLTSERVTDAMSRVLTKSEDPEVRRYVRNQHRAYFSAFSDREVLLEAYEASISHTVAEVAVHLKMPTLLVVGAQDDLGSVAAQRRMASWIRRHRLEILEDAGHLIHYEAPDRAAELVHHFLSSPAPEPVELHDELPAADLAPPNTAQFTALLPIVRRRRRP